MSISTKLLLFGLAILGSYVWLADKVSAEAYPYAGMACTQAPYRTSGTGAAWCPDYDWGVRRNDTSSASTISPYGYAYRNCTDYAAWRLDGASVSSTDYKGLGHAKTWGDRAKNRGLRVDALPSVGSIGVRTSGTYGHVAYVEEVNLPDRAPGTIRISQYNKQGTGVYSEAVGTPATLGLSQFVHFEDLTPLPPPVLESPPALMTVSPEEIPEYTEPVLQIAQESSQASSVAMSVETSADTATSTMLFSETETLALHNEAVRDAVSLLPAEAAPVAVLPEPTMSPVEKPKPLAHVSAISQKDTPEPMTVPPALVTASSPIVVPYVWHQSEILHPPYHVASLPRAAGQYAELPLLAGIGLSIVVVLSGLRGYGSYMRAYVTVKMLTARRPMFVHT